MSLLSQSQGRRSHVSSRRSWRPTLRSTGGTLLLVIALLGVGGMYLAVNAKVAEAGRRVLMLEARRQDLQQLHADLTSQLARLTAPEVMMARAIELGFRPARPDQVEYLVVEGYRPPDPFVAPRPPASGKAGVGRLSPAYTETLGEWMQRVVKGGPE